MMKGWISINPSWTQRASNGRGSTIARAEKYSRSSQATSFSHSAIWPSAAYSNSVIAQTFSSFSVSFSESSAVWFMGSELLCGIFGLLEHPLSVFLADSAATSASAHYTAKMVCSLFHHPVLWLLSLMHELLHHHHVHLRTDFALPAHFSLSFFSFFSYSRAFLRSFHTLAPPALSFHSFNSLWPPSASFHSIYSLWPSPSS